MPAFIIALLGSFQFDVNEVFNLKPGLIETLGAFLAVLFISIWCFSASDGISSSCCDVKKNLFQQIAEDTNYILCWVAFCFLLFELWVHFTGFDLTAFFFDWSLLLPLGAILIGLLPGCGPQILVTGLYLSGAIPMSAQIGNAISNDGDALFPAIALAPGAAFIATIYSAMPAFFVAYGYYFLFESM